MVQNNRRQQRGGKQMGGGVAPFGGHNLRNVPQRFRGGAGIYNPSRMQYYGQGNVYSGPQPWQVSDFDPGMNRFDGSKYSWKSNMSYSRGGNYQAGGGGPPGFYQGWRQTYRKGVLNTRQGGFQRGGARGMGGRGGGVGGSQGVWRGGGGGRGGGRGVGGRRGRGGGKVTKDNLDTDLEKYMGDDAMKGRLDTALDSYFGRSGVDSGDMKATGDITMEE